MCVLPFHPHINTLDNLPQPSTAPLRITRTRRYHSRSPTAAAVLPVRLGSMTRHREGPASPWIHKRKRVTQTRASRLAMAEQVAIVDDAAPAAPEETTVTAPSTPPPAAPEPVSMDPAVADTPEPPVPPPAPVPAPSPAPAPAAAEHHDTAKFTRHEMGVGKGAGAGGGLGLNAAGSSRSPLARARACDPLSLISRLVLLTAVTGVCSAQE